ncbi:MAG: hypothetical protein Fur0010_21490 [Bdellovibrio sp.]
MGCGQIDISYLCLKTKHVRLYEVKSSGDINRIQALRLRKSAQVISSLIPWEIHLDLVSIENLPKRFSFFNLF